MKKRILALLTCMALMLGMFPATAMADQQSIKRIDVTDITEPVKGANPDTTVSVATYASSDSEAYKDSIKTDGVTVTWYEISGKDKDHVTKADLTDTSKMTASDVFKLGKTYACEIKVQIDDSSFIVASDVSGKVNNATSYSMNTSTTDGTEVPICQDEGKTAVLYAVYELPAVTNVKVTTSLPCDNIGIVPMAPYSVTFTGNASTSGDNYFAWYELTEAQYKAGTRTTGTPMSLDDRTGDKFKSGKYYSLVINFVANGDSVISDDITATVTGTTDTAFTIQEDKKSAVLTAVYAPSAVYKVDVSVTDPKIGATADYKPTAKITTKGTASLAGAYWYKVAEDKDYNDRSNWIEMEKNEKFEKGYYYIFSALYSANSGYVMNKAATATVNNGKENSDLTKLQMEGITGFDTEKLLVVTALFDPLKDEPVTPADKSDSASPKTGDSDSDLLGLWTLLAIASLGAVRTVGYRRKKER